MKRLHLIILVLILATSTTYARKKELLILHTNDTHSCIMPMNPNLSDTIVAGRGGFLRRIAMLNEERKKCPDLLLFDSGDFSQGSSYYTLFKGDVEVGLMNLMKYDAATIGNHEFDFGLDNMARLFKKAEFPIVCANYDFTGTVVEGLVKPYAILNRKGVKIGVFGLSPEPNGLVFADNYKGMKYIDPTKAAKEAVRHLKDEGCDIIICLSHLGWDIEDFDDTDLTPQTQDIDLVLGGHTHTYFKELRYLNDANGKPVPNDQNGKGAVFVGKIRLKVKKVKR